jgi:transposase
MIGLKSGGMPEIQLPIFPAGSVEITRDLACRIEEDRVVYYNGHLPVFTHAKKDLASFRLFTSQLIVQGSATQGDISKAFGVPLIAIKRATKRFREQGAKGFFAPKPRREGSKLNAQKLEQARLLLLNGHSLPVVSQQTGVLTDTLRKAIAAGRLPPVKKTEPQPLPAVRQEKFTKPVPGHLPPTHSPFRTA